MTLTSVLLRLLVALWVGAGNLVLGGSIQASVVSEDGKPVPGAILTYRRLTDFYHDSSGSLSPKGAFVNKTAIVPADGNVLIKDLPAGRYVVCVYGSQPHHLASCEWNSPISQFTLAEVGQQSLKLVVRDGVTITFRIQDDLARFAAKQPFILGVMTTDGYYRRANLLAAEGKTQVMQVTVPKNVPVHLFADGLITLKDENGAEIPKKQRSLLIPATLSPISVNLITK